ncbi:MAG: Cys-tRNA(Pro) deacylase [Corynebacterium casei]|uniref:Cys-tRNA(Pro) deacylase n=1 Tax=Corynebacterium casei TaxID=160386 RepID=UPI001866DD6B|nr:Cys-tRNA(Pro) deacylase [Corynebacterium casei]MDN5901982.1 Cys-tRNA(Pro) deacylase [Corynebacterium casei]MDN6628220.1 Cys-tRNA(Pro) deacylase [Corynebacterium casei]MDN6673617.1 Cys-tRNA(Pro) deacylase [Corynebacterium casei]MDN6694253.1 Cys-tRNA(Pro) deacylase [Corynebacterium casei]MDN6738655.1 Cys-tRNA(Pro) deacylase [Corynebacterium casei]
MAKTPALQVVAASSVPHQVHSFDSGTSNFGEAAVESIGGYPARIFKTLVVELSTGTLAVCVIPVPEKLSLKRAAKALGAPKAAMADTAKAQRSSGYVPGGISPLGQKKKLATVIDVSAKEHETIYVSAGRRGLDLEIAAEDLALLADATFSRLTLDSHS